MRRHLAAGKPAYTVLSDQSLHEIARRRPTTLAQLGNIKGMGPVKLERYGSALLAVVETAPPSRSGAVSRAGSWVLLW